MIISPGARLIVAGGRNFANRPLMREAIIAEAPSLIISGGARGADQLAIFLAVELFIPVTTFLANWQTGKGAGFTRNRRMAEESEALLAFWDGQSKGTYHMIRTMQGLQKPVRIVRYV